MNDAAIVLSISKGCRLRSADLLYGEELREDAGLYVGVKFTACGCWESLMITSAALLLGW